MKRLLSLVFLLILGHYSQSQDSCALRISLLTCGPGEELYSTFGHTAIRVIDRSNGTDIVYNYGTFEFGDPQFYLHFTQGKLRYYLSRENFMDFMEEYRADGRSVEEQVLNLDCAEKDKLQAALFDNMRTEKKYYKYDFLFDNCTTRARDMVFQNAPGGLSTSAIVDTSRVTFRDNLHICLRAGHMAWSELGIDLLLGSRLDRPMNNQEAMFLPDYLEKGLDSTIGKEKKLVLSKGVLLAPAQLNLQSFTPPSAPDIIFWALLTMFIILVFIPNRTTQTALGVADKIIFLVTGLIGLLILFMWFGTEHQTCRDNYNLLWALPTHVFVAFLSPGGRKWVGLYYKITAVLSAVCVVMWFTHFPQQVPHALLPLFLLLSWRAWALSRA